MPQKHDFTQAIEMYKTQLMPLQEIADHFQVSRTAIHKFLRKNGVDTSKHKREVICHNCGKSFKKMRCMIRKSSKDFCCQQCYFSYTNNPEYNYHRQGQRIARKVFEQHCGFSFDYIIHHVDSNSDNNDISNLWAFKSQAEHMRFHRGGEALALIGKSQDWKMVRK